MTDPAHVTEAAPWWAPILAALVAAAGGIATWLRIRTESATKTHEAELTAQVELEREDTAQRRIDAETHAADEMRTIDLLSAERAEHRSCRDLVESQNAKITSLAVAVATCEAQHAHATDMIIWLGDRVADLEHRAGSKAPPPPKPRDPTPPFGTEQIQIPPRIKDARREP